MIIKGALRFLEEPITVMDEEKNEEDTVQFVFPAEKTYSTLEYLAVLTGGRAGGTLNELLPLKKSSLAPVYSKEDLVSMYRHYQDRVQALLDVCHSSTRFTREDLPFLRKGLLSPYTDLVRDINYASGRSRPLSVSQEQRNAHLTDYAQQKLMEQQHRFHEENSRGGSGYLQKLRQSVYLGCLFAAGMDYCAWGLHQDMGIKTFYEGMPPYTFFYGLMYRIYLYANCEEGLCNMRGVEASEEELYSAKECLSQALVAFRTYQYARTCGDFSCADFSMEGTWLFPIWLLSSPLKEDLSSGKSLQTLAAELIQTLLGWHYTVLETETTSLGGPTLAAQQFELSEDGNQTHSIPNIQGHPLVRALDRRLFGKNADVPIPENLRVQTEVPSLRALVSETPILLACDQGVLGTTVLDKVSKDFACISSRRNPCKPALFQEIFYAYAGTLVLVEPFLVADSLCIELAQESFYFSLDEVKQALAPQSLVHFVEGPDLPRMGLFLKDNAQGLYPRGSLCTFAGALEINRERLPSAMRWLPDALPFLGFGADDLAIPYFVLRNYWGVMQYLFPLDRKTMIQLCRLYGQESKAPNPLRSYSQLAEDVLNLSMSRSQNLFVTIFKQRYTHEDLSLSGVTSLKACLTGDTSIVPKGSDSYLSLIPSHIPRAALKF